jgi:FAD/FMN-containing dehydrogenase
MTTTTSPPRPSLSTDPFLPLREQVRGRVVTRGSGWWDVARAAWVTNVDQRPSAVVQATCAEDVVATVAFAAAHGLQVAPQGTGHNAAPLGDLDGTVLLTTSGLRGIEVDPARRTARVEAGVLTLELAEAAAVHGLAPLVGSSPDVGVVGYALGGGLSWFGRAHGLACSAVVAAEVVTADGRLRRVDEHSEPELLWALRGGGGSLAVVVALEVRLVPVTSVVAGALFWPAERGTEVWAAWRSFVDALPETTTSWARWITFPPLPEVPEPLRGGSFVVVEVCALDPADEALLAPLRALEPVMDTVAAMSVPALTHVHMDPEHPVPAVAEGLLLDDLPPEALAALESVAGPASGSPLLSVEVRHLGGALSRPGPGALDRLRARYAVVGVGVTPDASSEQRALAHLDRVLEALAPWGAGSAYLNFTHRRTPASAFFEPAALERLRAVKHRYDPADVIRSNHPVLV